MGTCRHCGHSAGWFRSIHPACQQKHDDGWNQMISLTTDAARGAYDLDMLHKQLTSLAESSYIPDSQMRQAAVEGWERALAGFLEDRVFSAEEQAHLEAFANRFNLSEQDLDVNGASTRAAMAVGLRNIIEGKLPSWTNIQLPFNLQKSESLVWLFKDVKYYEERVKRSYVGRSQGVSIRIAKGMYYRIGSFRGNPIETTQMEYIDSGLLGITTHNIYFAGARKNLRIAYPKVVAFTPYSDGIGVHRDAVSARPQIFVTGEGWFIYNLITNLAQLRMGRTAQ